MRRVLIVCADFGPQKLSAGASDALLRSALTGIRVGACCRECCVPMILVTAKTLVKYSAAQILKLIHGKQVVPLRVLLGPAKGSRLNLDVRSQASFWLGNYDEYAFSRLPFDRYLKEGDVAWDCGAFVGYYTAVFRKLVSERGRVVVFEASSINYTALSCLPALNGWGNVEIRHAAVGPDHMEIQFVSNLGGASGPYGLSKKYPPDRPLEVERVQCFGVDELVFEAGVPMPALIKFDLECAEEFALHNGARTFMEGRPVILLEIHGDAARDAAGRFLEIYGYGATAVHMLAEVAKADEGQWLRSLRENAVWTLKELQDLPEIHMLLTLPVEHRDWGSEAKIVDDLAEQ